MTTVKFFYPPQQPFRFARDANAAQNNKKTIAPLNCPSAVVKEFFWRSTSS